ncbi:lysozyme [Chryseobacterium indoltheticum]|uniref:Lysozyme n=1 Tax=Chryseobacterium indoltheticum TaxID=254 RepID=A0A3G6N2W4_9FLAO|nr:lysozyme [Chryseobacterium indoltheticum]AZA60768.1 lysozyme [Chryseobacterium indoltheticum]
MKTSQKGINLIKSFESLHDGDLKISGLQPKMDPSKIWTEGWGRAMRGNDGKFLKGEANRALAYKRATVKTLVDADKALAEDLIPREKAVLNKLEVPVNQNQFDALVSHYYNTGGSDTLFDLINKKRGKEAIYKWFTERYITSDGVVLNGLIRRRKAEADLFFS